MKYLRLPLLLSSLLCLALPARAELETYNIDPAHSFANFSIRHVVAKLSGTFSDMTGRLEIDRDNLAKSSVQAKISLLSVNTSHAKRDEHIKKSDYLDVANFADMQFKSTRIVATDKPNEGEVTGILTLHGVSKELSFPFKILGFGKDPWGGERIGIEAKTKIKASDYGFQWGLKPNAPVGDEIEVTLLIEGVKSK